MIDFAGGGEPARSISMQRSTDMEKKERKEMEERSGGHVDGFINNSNSNTERESRGDDENMLLLMRGGGGDRSNPYCLLNLLLSSIHQDLTCANSVTTQNS